jgi:uncharacterized protein YjiS (DUF1127 family)
MAVSNNIWGVPHRGTPSLTSKNTWLSRLHAGVSRIISGWETRRRNRRDAALLESLSDRQLWDLGFARGDISYVAKGTYRRD